MITTSIKEEGTRWVQVGRETLASGGASFWTIPAAGVAKWKNPQFPDSVQQPSTQRSTQTAQVRPGHSQSCTSWGGRSVFFPVPSPPLPAGVHNWIHPEINTGMITLWDDCSWESQLMRPTGYTSHRAQGWIKCAQEPPAPILLQRLLRSHHSYPVWVLCLLSH